MNRLRVLLVVVLVLGTWRVLMACGSSGNNNAQGGDAGDGGVSSSSSGGGSGSGSGGVSSSSSGGGSPCPVYQANCNGKCIPTAVDPNNCGGCGVKCAAGQVCASSACVGAGSCPPTTTACNGSCVDLQSDNANCGTCGHACPMGQGCVGGGCVPAVKLGPPPAKCNGGSGPPINVGDGGAATCAGNIGQTTFTWALCSCTDVANQDVLLTDAYDSTKGPYPNSKTPGGGVGLDRTYSSSSMTSVGGALWASSANGLTSDGVTAVVEELHVGGALNAQQFSVGYDGFVNGNVSCSPGTFAKNLTVPNGATVSGTTVMGQTIHVPPPVSVPPPCDCTPSKIIPVSAIVQHFAPPNDDNAAIGLDPKVLSGPGNPTRLDLPCGYYYLDSIANSVAVTVVAHGNTALFIGGSITPQTPLTITLDPTAQLDLFVAGTISSSDTLVIGAVNYPALSRTYVGSSMGLSFMSGTTLGSNLYAANASLDWSAGTDIYGSVFCGNFLGSSRVAIHYDSEILNIGGQTCGQPPPMLMCNGCADCGNQACINGMCGGACTSNSQCCAPLLCQAGKCVQAVQ